MPETIQLAYDDRDQLEEATNIRLTPAGEEFQVILLTGERRWLTLRELRYAEGIAYCEWRRAGTSVRYILNLTERMLTVREP